MADDASDYEGVGDQVTAKDGEAHQCHPISDAGSRVRLLAEGFSQDAPLNH
jgi:hypothetical protein